MCLRSRTDVELERVTSFTFNMPGIDFHLYVGQRIPKQFYNDCAYHSKEKFVGFMDNDELFVKPLLNLLRKSRPAGKLVNGVQRPRH